MFPLATVVCVSHTIVSVAHARFRHVRPYCSTSPVTDASAHNEPPLFCQVIMTVCLQRFITAFARAYLPDMKFAKGARA